ncbi:13680_t:CDS:2, partial [Racocetra persica]
SDINNNSFEDEVGFIDQIDYTNEMDYKDMVDLENNKPEQQEIEEEQVTNTTQVKKATSKKQKHNVNNSQSETEASTSTLTKKPSIVQKNLPKRKKGGSQVRSWVWKYFDRLISLPDKAVREKCKVVKNRKKCEHMIDTEDEWFLLADLTKVLKQFYDVTNLLGGTIMTIKQSLSTNIVEDEVVDYICLSDAFDYDPDLQDDEKNYDQIIAKEKTNKKNLKINNPQALLATILDPYNKRMDKATATNRFKAKSLLITEYELLKSDELKTDIQNNSKENEKNKLLHAIYSSNPQRV